MPKPTTCPHCESPMVPFDPPNPPWVCEECVRGFWLTELAPEAVAMWDPETRSYGMDLPAVALMDQVEAEAEQAAAVVADLPPLTMEP